LTVFFSHFEIIFSVFSKHLPQNRRKAFI